MLDKLLDKLTIQLYKDKLDSQLYKLYSKWIKDVNYEKQNYKLLEENMRGYLYHFKAKKELAK